MPTGHHQDDTYGAVGSVISYWEQHHAPKRLGVAHHTHVIPIAFAMDHGCLCR
jgi:hypothetical protein